MLISAMYWTLILLYSTFVLTNAQENEEQCESSTRTISVTVNRNSSGHWITQADYYDINPTLRHNDSDDLRFSISQSVGSCDEIEVIELQMILPPDRFDDEDPFSGFQYNISLEYEDDVEDSSFQPVSVNDDQELTDDNSGKEFELNLGFTTGGAYESDLQKGEDQNLEGSSFPLEQRVVDNVDTTSTEDKQTTADLNDTTVKKFVYHAHRLNNIKAKTSCVKDGMELADVATDDDFDSIIHIIKNNNGTGKGAVWIGSFNQGLFEQNSEPLPEGIDSIRCLGLKKNGRVIYGGCRAQRAFVCQFKENASGMFDADGKELIDIN